MSRRDSSGLAIARALIDRKENLSEDQKIVARQFCASIDRYFVRRTHRTHPEMFTVDSFAVVLDEVHVSSAVAVVSFWLTREWSCDLSSESDGNCEILMHCTIDARQPFRNSYISYDLSGRGGDVEDSEESDSDDDADADEDGNIKFTTRAQNTCIPKMKDVFQTIDRKNFQVQSPRSYEYESRWYLNDSDLYPDLYPDS